MLVDCRCTFSQDHAYWSQKFLFNQDHACWSQTFPFVKTMPAGRKCSFLSRSCLLIADAPFVKTMPVGRRHFFSKDRVS
nr:hypothetical protein CFP56_68868 [Quercus suber]